MKFQRQHLSHIHFFKQFQLGRQKNQVIGTMVWHLKNLNASLSFDIPCYHFHCAKGPKPTLLYSNCPWIQSLYLPLPKNIEWEAEMSIKHLGIQGPMGCAKPIKMRVHTGHYILIYLYLYIYKHAYTLRNKYSTYVFINIAYNIFK